MTAPTTAPMPVEVDPPVIERYPYGLLSAARVATEPDTRWEAHGVVYMADSCGPSGGVWTNPCSRLPAGPATVYTLAISKPAGVDQLYLTLTGNAYGRVPVTVTVGVESQDLFLGEQADPIDVTPTETVSIAASIPESGDYPACADDLGFVIPDTDESGFTQLSCVATIPAQADQTKVIESGLSTVEGYSFIVYEGLSCLSLSPDEAATRAERRLGMHEQYWVERQADTALLRDNVTVLGGGTAQPLAVGIGLLEDAIAELYGGTGTIHAARELAAPMVSKALARRDGARMRSPLDNVLAFGAGYSTDSPAGADAPPGQAWIYATGPVTARRSEIQIREVFDLRRNTRIALAERSYSLTADCLRAAVLIQIPET